jgi:hypothetical protein
MKTKYVALVQLRGTLKPLFIAYCICSRAAAQRKVHRLPSATLGSRNARAVIAAKEGENTMGLLEELAGAVVAVEGVKKLDPNAGILEEGAAAVVGFEGTEAIVNHFEKKDENQ